MVLLLGRASLPASLPAGEAHWLTNPTEDSTQTRESLISILAAPKPLTRQPVDRFAGSSLRNLRALINSTTQRKANY